MAISETFEALERPHELVQRQIAGMDVVFVALDIDEPQAFLVGETVMLAARQEQAVHDDDWAKLLVALLQRRDSMPSA